MKLNRRQLKKMIMQEMMNSSSSNYPLVKNRRALNEGIGATIAAVVIGAPLLAYVAIAAWWESLPGADTYEDEEGNMVYIEPPISDRKATAKFNDAVYGSSNKPSERDIPKITEKIKSDPTLKRAAAEVGQRVLSGEDAMQAAKDVIQSDAAVAQTLKDCCVDPTMTPRSKRSKFDSDGIDF